MGCATLAFGLTRPYALGLHDEGLYLAAAKSLREAGEYRLINLPSSPPQTKYPPAYSAILALTAGALRLDSADVKPLKAVNAIWFALVIVLAGELARVMSGGRAAVALVASLLAGTSQALVTHVDIICSDLMFIAVLLMAMLLLTRHRSGPVDTGLGGTLIGMAILTRTIGVAALGSTGLREVWQHRWRTLAVLAPGMILAGAWVLWCMSHRATVGVLEQYYVVYERFAWLDLWSQPRFVWRMVSNNAIHYLLASPWALGAPDALTTAVLAVGTSIGAWNAQRHRLFGDLVALGVCYAVTLMAYPAVFARYLLPAAPIVCALSACSIDSASEVSASSRLRRYAGIVCVVVLLLVNLIELVQYARQPQNRVHTGFGRYLPFGAEGFLQTADWIRRNTPPAARLASANDTAYFTLTGRQGVRPWPHEPETYEAAYAVMPRPIAVDVTRELERLHIDYLVVDPYLPDLEGAHAARYVDLILHAPAECWTLAFTSDDGLHRVYRRSPSDSCPSR
jgi:hypothetical protein